jgi:membrane-associated phospholipid phosphatase
LLYWIISSVSLARVSGGRGTLLVTIAAFAALSAAAGAGLLRDLDQRLLRISQARSSPGLDALGSALSVPGRAELSIAALAGLAVWLYARGRGRLGRRLLVALAATTIVEIAMKFVVPQTPIPGDVGRVPDPSLVDFATPYPYPSGHMLRAVLLLGAIYALWPNRVGRLLVLLALAGAAWARVYLGTHWPSDVLGGALLGLAGLLWALRGGQSRKPGGDRST